MLRFKKVLLFTAVFSAVTVIPGTASAQLTFWNNQGTFQTNLTGNGNSMLGFEDWEESTTGNNTGLAMNDPLNSGTSNAYFSAGDINQYLNVQSNLGGSNSSVLNPRGTDGLLMANNLVGYGTDWVGSNFFPDSFDMVFSTGMFGVGGNLISPIITNAGPLRIDIYDTANIFLGTTTFTASPTAGFWGVTSTVAIGRINLFSSVSSIEGMDNIEMWGAANPVPEPFTMGLLGGAALAGYRRVRARKVA